MGKRWTPEEDRMIVQHYDPDHPEELAVEMDRTPAAVRSRAYLLRHKVVLLKEIRRLLRPALTGRDAMSILDQYLHALGVNREE